MKYLFFLKLWWLNLKRRTLVMWRNINTYLLLTYLPQDDPRDRRSLSTSGRNPSIPFYPCHHRSTNHQRQEKKLLFLPPRLESLGLKIITQTASEEYVNSKITMTPSKGWRVGKSKESVQSERRRRQHRLGLKVFAKKWQKLKSDRMIPNLESGLLNVWPTPPLKK